MLSEVIRFTLSPSLTISAAAFVELRRTASAAGAISQYYGYSIGVGLYDLQKKRHEITWLINWPDKAIDRAPIHDSLKALSTGDAVSLLFHFPEEHVKEVFKAFDAPFCEFACIRLRDDAPLQDAALQKSMHQTYLDTYQILGFTGGYWAYCVNTNDASEVSYGEGHVDPDKRRLAIYPLGWESIELHQDGTKTTAFATEINKLKPYFGGGTSAWYVPFRKHG